MAGLAPVDGVDDRRSCGLARTRRESCAAGKSRCREAVRLAVERIGENCEPALCSVLFMGGAGGSLRAGVTENPVNLTRSVRQALTRVTCGGAPVYVWPGGGITFMVDVSRLPKHAFGYVPTPALVAPIEFTMRREDYAALGGHIGLCARCGGTARAQQQAHGCRVERQSLAARRPSVSMTGPVGRRLDDGRLHFQHGPIDLIITIGRPCLMSSRSRRGAAGSGSKRYLANWRRVANCCASLLPPPCEERRREAMPRSHANRRRCPPTPHPSLPDAPQGEGNSSGNVARAMATACRPFADRFITPMAAVAGAVADEILASMRPCPPLRRALINNGGDIAFYLGRRRDGDDRPCGTARGS